jgi:hypothetical protein
MPRTKAWIRLALGVALLLAFIFGLAPALRLVPAVDRMHRHVDARGIDADALFYTDLDESAEAENFIRHALKRGKDWKDGK